MTSPQLHCTRRWVTRLPSRWTDTRGSQDFFSPVVAGLWGAEGGVESDWKFGAATSLWTTVTLNSRRAGGAGAAVSGTNDSVRCSVMGQVGPKDIGCVDGFLDLQKQGHAAVGFIIQFGAGHGNGVGKT